MSENLENNNLIAKWLAGDLTPAEKEALEKEGDLDDLKFAMDDIADWSLPPMDVESGLQKLKEKRLPKSEKTKVISINNWMKVAAAVALLIVSYFGWNLYNNSYLEITTGIAETKTHTLPNGSVVKLDALASVSYDTKAWEEERNIKLSGQAYFDVTKGKSFIVSTTVGDISVLGTQFNVKVENGLFAVQCFEGSVMVKVNDQEAILKPGQNVEWTNGQLIEKSHDHDTPYWAEGFSEYQETNLTEVVNDLNKYYEIDLILPNKYNELTFTGKVTQGDLDKALRTIFDTMEIKYVLKDDGKVVFE